MLTSELKEQVKTIFAHLEADYIFDITASQHHDSFVELTELLKDVADCSEKITCRVKDGSALEFAILKNQKETGIRFRGVPNGHEFTSLLMAILNSDGKGKNIPDEAVCKQIGRAHV